MIENIKSPYVIDKILKYINKRDVLNIFRYNKLFQTKLGFTKNDYLFEFCNKIPEIKLLISKNSNEEAKVVNGVQKLLKSLNKDILKKKVLKENICEYLAVRGDFCLSINHIFFRQIIKKKIELGIKNVKIKLYLNEGYLTGEDIFDLTTSQIKDRKIIEKKIKLNNDFIKKLEILLNYDIFICELYFVIEDEYICGLYFNRDSIELKENENENNDLKNFKIRFELKRAELINKILEKNCKNIIKLDYFVHYKMNNDDYKFKYPLIELDKFENLVYLGLDIFYKESKEALIYNLPNVINKLDKLKSLKIKGKSYHGFLNVYIKREILDKLDVLKIKNVNWIIEDNETLHLKNIKELNFKISKFPEKYIEHKKYFFEEILKGNVIWEKLNKLKITSIFTDLEDIIKNNIEYWINKEIIYFFKIADLREGYENSKSQFFFFFSILF